jgi:hypothetical protein
MTVEKITTPTCSGRLLSITAERDQPYLTECLYVRRDGLVLIADIGLVQINGGV